MSIGRKSDSGMIVQLNQSGGFAVPEHKAEINEVFKSFSGKEIEIKITEVNEFTTLLEEAINLQNRFAEMTSESNKSWTNEQFTALRAKMSTSYYHLIDEFAKAKSDEKKAIIEKEICLETLRATFINDNSPSASTTKAKSNILYKQTSETYLQAYQIRSLLELHLKALDLAMNSISGIQKHDVNKLKF